MQIVWSHIHTSDPIPDLAVPHGLGALLLYNSRHSSSKEARLLLPSHTKLPILTRHWKQICTALPTPQESPCATLPMYDSHVSSARPFLSHELPKCFLVCLLFEPLASKRSILLVYVGHHFPPNHLCLCFPQAGGHHPRACFPGCCPRTDL